MIIHSLFKDRRAGLSAGTLKAIALILMTVNHLFVAYHSPLANLFDGLFVLQMMVTRAAFPIYAFLITEGLHHTRDRRNISSGFSCLLLYRSFLSILRSPVA